MAINIRNNKNRDAVVALETVVSKREVRYVDEKNRPVTSHRVLKSDVEHDLPKILGRRKNLNTVSKQLIDDDPEIDLEKAGMFLTDTSRVYVSKNGIAHLVEEYEIIKDPGGKVKKRRLREKAPQNISSDVPLKWTGKFIKKEEAARRFVFTNTRQLMHVNGLTFDFLFDMAKELDKRKSLLLLRGGESGDEPIVLNRGGRPYNGFLEGRVKGSSYLLLLHLSNMELKKPELNGDDTD